MNTESVNPDFRPALCGVLIHNAAVGRLIPLILFIADDCGENCLTVLPLFVKMTFNCVCD